MMTGMTRNIFFIWIKYSYYYKNKSLTTPMNLLSIYLESIFVSEIWRTVNQSLHPKLSINSNTDNIGPTSR